MQHALDPLASVVYCVGVVQAWSRTVLVTLLLSRLIGASHEARVTLQHVSTVYVPSGFHGNVLQYEFGSNAVQRAALEAGQRMIYAVGPTMIHIIDASDQFNLTYVTHVSVSDKKLTDVALCGDHVFVTYVNTRRRLRGGVLQYGLYDVNYDTMLFVRDINVRGQPKRLVATATCTLVVSLENPGVCIEGRLRDSPGAVAVVKFSSGVESTPTVSSADFTAFNDRVEELEASGVRWVYRSSRGSLSDDLEPEGVTLNAEQTKAYVSLQENNAIAVLDLRTENITSLHGLGIKDWSQLRMDPSDQDGGARMSPWPVLAVYQPGALHWFRWEGRDYVITANEGAAKSYNCTRFSDFARGKDFNSTSLSASLSFRTREALQDDTQLGRLWLSTVEGRDPEGRTERLVTLGGRSFSVRRAGDLGLVYDSDDQLEHRTNLARPDLFNGGEQDRNATVASSVDTSSDSRGPRPTAVVAAEVQGMLVMFVASGSSGTIAVYTVAPGDDIRPSFRSLYSGGVPRGNRTWQQLYEDRQLHAVHPEYLVYLEPGLLGFPALLTVGSASGTVSILKVVTQEEVSTATSLTAAGPAAIVMTVFLSVLVVIH